MSASDICDAVKEPGKGKAPEEEGVLGQMLTCCRLVIVSYTQTSQNTQTIQESLPLQFELQLREINVVQKHGQFPHYGVYQNFISTLQMHTKVQVECDYLEC